MDRKMISQALGGIDEKFILEALYPSGRAYAQGKENDNMSKKGISKGGRVLLVAAVLGMVLALGVGAAYVAFTRYENPDEVMGAFGGGEANMSGEGYEEYETVEIDGEERVQLSELQLGWERLSADEALLQRLVYPYVAAVEGGFTCEDYTVTMEACIYDKETLCGILYYTVENPNGIDWEYKNGTLLLEPNVAVNTGFGGRAFVDEERSTDTKLYISEHFIVIPDWLDNDAPFVHGLRIHGDYNGVVDLVPYLEQWEAIEVPHIELADGSMIVDPFSMAFSQTGIGSQRGTNHQYIALRFADGSEYVVYDRPNLFANEVSNCSTEGGWVTHMFNSIIDINEVVEVQIDEFVFRAE